MSNFDHVLGAVSQIRVSSGNRTHLFLARNIKAIFNHIEVGTLWWPFYQLKTLFPNPFLYSFCNVIRIIIPLKTNLFGGISTFVYKIEKMGL